MAGKTIDALYAWVATEPDGGEGVCSFQLGNTHMPLVGADMDRIKSLRRFAEIIRRASGCPIRLVRFSTREDLEELPGKKAAGRVLDGRTWDEYPRMEAH
jgi:protein gp37